MPMRVHNLVVASGMLACLVQGQDCAGSVSVFNIPFIPVPAGGGVGLTTMATARPHDSTNCGPCTFDWDVTATFTYTPLPLPNPNNIQVARRAPLDGCARTLC